MEQQLRLADRRGVFSRPISAPAEFGLMILQMLEHNAATERQVHDVRVALVGNDPSRLQDLFPQWFPPTELMDGTPEAEAALLSGEAVEDWSEVQWLGPSDMEDMGPNSNRDELLRLAESLFASSQVSVSQTSDGDWV